MSRIRIRRSAPDQAGASGAHAFVAPPDARSGLALGATQPGFQMTAPMAVADASTREARCALPGCGKPRHDLIHWPAVDAS
jgi:hypothetical protein